MSAARMPLSAKATTLTKVSTKKVENLWKISIKMKKSNKTKEDGRTAFLMS